MSWPLRAFLLYAIASIAAVVAARFLPKNRKLRYALTVASLLGICIKAAFVNFPRLELVFGGDLYVYFERDFAIPFGVAFFAFIAELVPDERSRRAVKLMPAVLVFYLVAMNVWVFSTPTCYTKSDGIWRKGVCLQSTGYTCGAASVATLLRAKGMQVSEHDAARASCTIPDRGVTNHGAAKALRYFLPGARVAIRLVPLEEIEKAPQPCLLPLKFNFFFDHMTVLMRVEGPDRFLVGDPLQ
ncbi:MAG: hypothetical protein ACAI25_14040, partial [Planctomycetota bacterium]